MSEPPVLSPSGLPEISTDDRTMALLAHLSMFIAPCVGPIILWALKNDTSPFVAYHAIQAAVFQGVSYAIIFVLTFAGVIGSMACPCCGLVSMASFVVVFGAIYPAIKSYNGEWVGYPLLDGIGRPPGV